MLPSAERFAAIEQHLGADFCQYARKKHEGGKSGQKGPRYEALFIAIKVAEFSSALLLDENCLGPRVGGQVPGFVDDAAVFEDARTSYYQCKNAQSVAWTSGAHPIAEDFRLQMALSEKLREPDPSTWLVVPTEALRDSLVDGIPSDILAHSRVQYFPYCGGKMARLVQEHEWIQSLLRPLATIADAPVDTLVGVLMALHGGCGEVPEGCHVRGILEIAAKYNPGQIRVLPATVNWTDRLDPALRRTLANIVGLRYDADRGFFNWSAFGTSGIFGFDCSDKRFSEFSRSVVEAQPVTFADLEPLLIV